MSSEVSSGPVAMSAPGAAARPRRTAVRVLSLAAQAGIVATLVVFAALHLLPPTREISSVRRTISEYALTSSAWAFDLAVIALACSSAAVFAGLIASRRVGPVSAGSVFGAVWVAGLLTLVSFPKHNWALDGGAGHSGQIHRLASLVAFLALPVAVLAIARRRPDRPHPASAGWAFWLATTSLLWFAPIVVAVITWPRSWWQEIPLGLIERGLALTEVMALIALTLLMRAPNASESPRRTSHQGEAPIVKRPNASKAS